LAQTAFGSVATGRVLSTDRWAGTAWPDFCLRNRRRRRLPRSGWKPWSSGFGAGLSDRQFRSTDVT